MARDEDWPAKHILILKLTSLGGLVKAPNETIHVMQAEIPRLDFIMGIPPCQGLSIAGELPLEQAEKHEFKFQFQAELTPSLS